MCSRCIFFYIPEAFIAAAAAAAGCTVKYTQRAQVIRYLPCKFVKNLLYSPGVQDKLLIYYTPFITVGKNSIRFTLFMIYLHFNL